MPQYSALTCWRGAKAGARLQGALTDAEFAAIGQLLAALIDEGPVDGISALEKPAEVLENYLIHAAGKPLPLREHANFVWWCRPIPWPAWHPLGLEDCEVLLAIQNYARDTLQNSDLAGRYGALLASERCREVVRAALGEGQGAELAIALGIPCREPLLQAMRRDFARHHGLCRWLMDEPASAQAVLELFRQHIPPEAIEQAPQDTLGLGPEYEACNRLDLLIQELRGKPGLGEDYLARTLFAPTNRCRSLTLRVLRSWVAATHTPLAQLSPELWARLKEAEAGEPAKNLRQAMRPLLDGVTDFPESQL